MAFALDMDRRAGTAARRPEARLLVAVDERLRQQADDIKR